MKADIDYRLLLQSVEKAPRYLLKELTEKINSILPNQDICSRNIPTQNYQDVVEEDVPRAEVEKLASPEDNRLGNDNELISFEVSPSNSPVPFHKINPTGQEGGTSSNFKTGSAKSGGCKSQKNQPNKSKATVKKSPGRTSVPEYPSKLSAKRYEVKSKHLDKDKAAGILKSVQLKETPGLSNKSFFENLAKEFNLPFKSK